MENKRMEDSENQHETEEVSASLEPTENVDGTLEYDPEEWTKAPKKCPKTGRFLPGTGVSRKGGRPRGAKDKISRQLIEICTELVADKGSEILEHLAKTDPAAAMAICLKVVPNSEWMQAHTEERTGENSGQQDVTIRLVSAPTENRLESPVERLTSPDRDLEMVVTEPTQEPTEAPLSDPIEPVDQVFSEPTQADMDAVAAREARERQVRQNEVIRQYGGLTGRKARGSSGNGIEYPDDGGVI